METDEVCRALSITATNYWVMFHPARLRLLLLPQIRMLAADAV
jgi:hypothetical protein